MATYALMVPKAAGFGVTGRDPADGLAPTSQFGAKSPAGRSPSPAKLPIAVVKRVGSGRH